MSIYTGFKDGYDKYVEVFKNPSQKELAAIQSWKESNDVRAFLLLDGTLLIWDSYGTIHDDAALCLGLDERHAIPLVLSKKAVVVTEGYAHIEGLKPVCKKRLQKAKEQLQKLVGEYRLSFWGEREIQEARK